MIIKRRKKAKKLQWNHYILQDEKKLNTFKLKKKRKRTTNSPSLHNK